VLHEVEELTAETYREREIGRVEPPAIRGLRGVHTIDRAGSIVVFDVKQRLPRPCPRGLWSRTSPRL
jgi:hypothetical protein